jgi:hypothetical protein
MKIAGVILWGYFTAIWYICWPFVNFVVLWYIFPRFGIFNTKNLATLREGYAGLSLALLNTDIFYQLEKGRQK